MRLNVKKCNAYCQTDPNFNIGPLSQDDRTLTSRLKQELDKDFTHKRKVATLRNSKEDIDFNNMKVQMKDEENYANLRSSGEMS